MKLPKYSKFLPFAIVALFLGGMFSSCNTEPKELLEEVVPENEDYEEYYEFQGFSLHPFSLSAMIMLPDETANIGAVTKPEVKHPDGYIWDVHVGAKFHLHIEDYGNNFDLVESKKEQLDKQSIFSIEYLVNDPDLIVYSQKLIVEGVNNAPKTVGVEHKSFHVYGQKKINGINYEFSSPQDGTGQKIIDLMAKSIRSVEEIQAS